MGIAVTKMATISFILVVLLGAIRFVQALVGDVVPGAFIVEYEDDVDVESHLSSVRHIATTRLKLDYQLFKGASLRFHDIDRAQEQADVLASTPAVKRIWPVSVYDIPSYTVLWNAGEDATAEGKSVPTKRQEPADTFSPHVMTQVNRLRDEGFVGDGVKIAVVDSGVSSFLEF